MKLKRWLPYILIVILLILAVFLFAYEKQRRTERIETQTSETGTVNPDRTARIEMYSDEVSIKSNGYQEKRRLLEPAGFTARAEYSAFTQSLVTVRLDEEETISGDDVLLLYFEAYAHQNCSELDVELLDIQGNTMQTVKYYLNVQKTAYYLPVSEAEGLGAVKFSLRSDDETISLGNVGLYDYGPNVDISRLTWGPYMIEEGWDEYTIPEDEGIGTGPAIDVISDGKYLYTGVMDGLYISSLETPNSPKVVAEVENLGAVRRLAFCNNNQTLLVASREYGVFVIDIQSPENPQIVSHIDTLELVSGLSVSGPYVFFASRYYGIEIYDLSDPKNPRFCSAVKSDEVSERIDCVVNGTYLYAGVWGTQRVEIFDVSDVSTPEYVGYIGTDGNAYGLDIYENNLVVSTGFHSVRNDYSSAESPGYGMGNGISIYDISDPEKPKWQSTARIDGRYYYIGLDYWNVKVVDGMAYLSDLYNGLYVLDITNPRAPKRVAHVTVPIPAVSERYVDLNQPENVFPYDKEAMVCSPVLGTAVGDGFLYIAGYYTDTHVLSFQAAGHKEQASPQGKLKESGESCYDKEALRVPGYSSQWLDIPGQSYVVVGTEDKLFVGNSQGILVYDSSMNLLDTVYTDHAVRDMKIWGNYIYTAEGVGGMGIYENSGGKIQKLSTFIPKDSRSDACSQIAVSPDGNYALLQCRISLLEVVNVRDPYNPVFVEACRASSMYYRNINQGYFNGNTIFVSHGGGVSEFVFENGGYTYHEIPNIDFYYSRGAFAVLDARRILAICHNGYQVLDVSEGMENVKADPLVRLPGKVLLKGYPVIKDNLLLVTDTASGQITLADISDLENPQVIADVYIEGNPDASYISDNGTIYIPSRYEGLLVLRRENK